MNPESSPTTWLCLACGNIGPIDDGACEACGSFRLTPQNSSNPNPKPGDNKPEHPLHPRYKPGQGRGGA